MTITEAQRPPSRFSLAMPEQQIARIVLGLRGLLAVYRVWSERRATERALAAMPLDLCKDIGWPAPGDEAAGGLPQEARATVRRPA